MKAITLLREEALRMGFTDLFILRYSDFVSTVAGPGAGSVEVKNLLALNIGDVVWAEVLQESKTLWSEFDSGLAVGVTGNTGKFIPAHAITDLYTASGAAVAPHVVTAAGTYLVAEVTPGVGKSNSIVTAGEVWIWARISKRAQRNLQA